MRYPGSICDVPGILVGQVSDREAMTGTTSVGLISPKGVIRVV